MKCDMHVCPMIFTCAQESLIVGSYKALYVHRLRLQAVKDHGFSKIVPRIEICRLMFGRSHAHKLQVCGCKHLIDQSANTHSLQFLRQILCIKFWLSELKWLQAIHAKLQVSQVIFAKCHDL